MNAGMKNRIERSKIRLIRLSAPKLHDDVATTEYEAYRPLQPPVRFDLSVRARIDAELQAGIDAFYASQPSSDGLATEETLP